MKILIVDDEKKNLEAARKAAEDYSEHEFKFTHSAQEAKECLQLCEGIITDLFFANFSEMGDINEDYDIYLNKLSFCTGDEKESPEKALGALLFEWAYEFKKCKVLITDSHRHFYRIIGFDKNVHNNVAILRPLRYILSEREVEGDGVGGLNFMAFDRLRSIAEKSDFDLSKNNVKQLVDVWKCAIELCLVQRFFSEVYG